MVAPLSFPEQYDNGGGWVRAHRDNTTGRKQGGPTDRAPLHSNRLSVNASADGHLHWYDRDVTGVIDTGPVDRLVRREELVRPDE